MSTIRSMTGYGRSAVERGGVEITCEVKSVNHRFLDLALRLPANWAAGEARLSARLRARFERGRLEVQVRRRGVLAARPKVTVDLGLAKAWLEALQRIGAHLHVPAAVDALHLSELPGVVTVEDESDLESDLALAEEALDAAGTAVQDMRAAEGARLAADLHARCDRLAELRGEIAAAVVEAGPRAAGQLRDRVAALLAGAVLEESRVLQEVALLADRADVSEELARLDSHVEQVRAALAAGGAVGRRLDFLAQELHREVNTMGSKLQDLAARRLVLEMKAEVEKVREQAQNVE